MKKLANYALGVLLLALPAGLHAAEASAPSQEPSPAGRVRIIQADWTAIRGPRSEVWRECVGAGRAGEGLRADCQRQLKIVQEEIGFKSIRFHGLLQDEMGVYSEFKKGKPREWRESGSTMSRRAFTGSNGGRLVLSATTPTRLT